MTLPKYLTLSLISLIILLPAAIQAATPDLPQTMIINGLVSSSKTVTTKQNDLITAYNATLADVEAARGNLDDNQGSYSLTITLAAENRDNTIYFTYTQAATGNVYELVDSEAANANRAELPFAGGGFPFPNVVSLNMYIGRLISRGSTNSSANAAGTATGTPAADTTGNPDVNRDGKVDENDVFMVNQVRFGSKVNLTPADIKNADVNGDGVVNMDDIIAIMRHK